MLGIVFTAPSEATAFLHQHLGGRPEAFGEESPIETDDALVAVTGTGKIKAALATERLLRAHNVDRLLHTGHCTALSDDLSLGAVVGATFVLEGDRVELEAPTYPRMPLECPYGSPTEGTIVSQDHTSDGDEQGYWVRIADARDDTAYAVAYVAAQHGIPCHVVKAVSNAANRETDAEEAGAEAANEAIASFLEPVVQDRAEASS